MLINKFDPTPKIEVSDNKDVFLTVLKLTLEEVLGLLPTVCQYE